MSPVNPTCPEPLATALKRMEGIVQSTKGSLAFAAPELHDFFWGKMQTDLADLLCELIAPEPDPAT